MIYGCDLAWVTLFIFIFIAYFKFSINDLNESFYIICVPSHK